jgi:hypothetical protein
VGGLADYVWLVRKDLDKLLLIEGFPRHREQVFGVAATRVNGGTIDGFVESAEWRMSG